MRTPALLAAGTAVAATAAIAAGCGGSSHKASTVARTPAKTSTTAHAAATGTMIGLRSTKLGMVLVDPQGRTLYLFEKDTGTSSTCSAACAGLWPPVTTSGMPKAGSGIDQAKLGTTMRSDGTTEVTYNGHPLYRYAGDTGPGTVNGEGLNQFGAKWYVLNAAGSKIDKD
jgi:predicted lipoprotein with Yx(FWY)xxD motif